MNAFTYHTESEEGVVSDEWDTPELALADLGGQDGTSGLTIMADWQAAEIGQGVESATILFHDCPMAIMVRTPKIPGGAA